MFILKEDVNTIFRRIGDLEDENERLRNRVSLIEKQQKCAHPEIRGDKRMDRVAYLPHKVCAGCGMDYGRVTWAQYHELEIEYHKLCASRANA